MNVLASCNGLLYAGVNSDSASVYVSSDGYSWSGVPAPTCGGAGMKVLTGFNGALYGADACGKVWVYNGRSWDAGRMVAGAAINALSVLNGKLYAADVSGRLWARLGDNAWALTNGGDASGPQLNSLAAVNGRLYAGGWDGSAGRLYRHVPSAALVTTAGAPAADGTLAVSTLSATSLQLVQSTNSATCSGLGAGLCGATNQVIFTQADLAGNARVSGPYALLVDTVAPTVSLTGLASLNMALTLTATGQDNLTPVTFNFQASTDASFNTAVATSGFISTTYYQFAGLLTATTYYARVTARDLAGNLSAPSLWLSTQTSGALLWSYTAMAATSSAQGVEVALASFTLTNPNATAAFFQSLTVRRVGGQDSDILTGSGVGVYIDNHHTGVFASDDSPIGTGGLSNGAATIAIDKNWQMIPAVSTSPTYFLVFTLDSKAQVNDTLSAVIDASTSVGVSYPFVVPTAGFPAGSNIVTVQDSANTLSVSTQTLPGAFAQPNTEVLMLTLTADPGPGTSTLDSLVVYLGGTIPSNGATANVYLDNGNGVFDGPSQDTLLGSNVFTADISTVNFKGTGLWARTVKVPTKVYVTLSLANDYTNLPGKTFSVSLASASELALDGALDTVAYATSPIVSAQGSVVVNNALTATFFGGAPAAMTQGVDYQVAAASMTVDVGLAGVNELDISLVGNTADVTGVKVYLGGVTDAGQYSPTDQVLGSAVFSSNLAAVSLTTVPVTAGATAVLYVVYTVAPDPQSTPGDILGAKIIGLKAINTLTSVTTLPTLPWSASTGSIVATINTIQVKAFDATPGSLTQGDRDVSILRLKLWSDKNPVPLTKLQVNRFGTGPDGDLAALKIYRCDSCGSQLTVLTSTLVTRGSDLLSAGAAALAFSPAQSITASTATYFVTLDVSSNATPGDVVQLEVLTTGQFFVNPPNLVSTTTVSWPIAVAPAMTINQFHNTVSVSTVGYVNPSGAYPGAANVELMSLALKTNVSNAGWVSVRIDEAGTAQDVDVSALKLWYDFNHVGTFYPTQTSRYQLVTPSTLTFQNGTVNLVFLSTAPPLSSQAQTYYLTVDLATGAWPGRTVVASVFDQTYFAVNSPNHMGPLSTFNAPSLMIAAPQSWLYVLARDSAPASAVQGTPAVPMLALDLWMQRYTGQFYGVTLTRNGTAGSAADADISGVKLYYDKNHTGALDVWNEPMLASGTFSGGQITLSFAPQTVGVATQTYFVAYDFSASAKAGNVEGVTAGPFVVAFPNNAVLLSTAASSQTQITPTQSGVFVNSHDLAPISILQGTTSQPFLELALNTTAQTVLVSALSFQRLGTSADSDVARLRVYVNSACDGTIHSGDLQVASAANPFTGPVSLSPPLSVNPQSQCLLIALDMGAFASNGKTVGVSIVSTGNVTVPLPNYVVADADHPYPMSSSAIPITKVPDTLSLLASNLLINNVIEGLASPAIRLQAWVSRQQTVWDQLVLNKFGSLPNAASLGVDQVRVYQDTDGNGVWSGADLLIGTATFADDGSATVDFSSAQTVGLTTSTYFVVLALDINATIGDTIGLSLQSFNVVPPDSWNLVGGTFQTSMVTVLDGRTPVQPQVSMIGGPFSSAYSSSFDSLSFVWTSTVVLGHIQKAYYAVGTSSGGNQIVDWTSMTPTPGTMSVTGLFLYNGTTYYVSVKAASDLGYPPYTSPVGSGSGQMVDSAVPPMPQSPTAIVGSNSIAIYWNPVLGGASGIAGYIVEFRQAESPTYYNAKTMGVSALSLGAAATQTPALSTSVVVATPPYMATNLPQGTLYVRVRSVSWAGLVSDASPEVRVQNGGLPAVGIVAGSAYPNPFDSRKGSVNIVFTLAAPASVNISISSIYGVKLRSFSVAGVQGDNVTTWDGATDSGAKVSKGIYIAVLSTGGATQTVKIGVIH